MHIPGESNKVADCLSRYYENDRFDEIHESHVYVSADVRLDPNHEDLTELRLQELAEDNPKTQQVNNSPITDNDNASNVNVHHTLLARRLRDRDEGRVQQATEMAEAARIANVPDPQTTDDDGKDMTVAEALQDGPSLRKIVLGDKTFLAAMRDGYKNDSVFSKVVNNPGHYPVFRVIDDLVYTKNRLGQDCLCVP